MPRKEATAKAVKAAAAILKAPEKATAEEVEAIAPKTRKKPTFKKQRYSVKRTLNRDPATINTSGLEAYRAAIAPDAKGDTVVLTAKVDPGDKDFLLELPEGVSYHVRQAVRAYVAGLKKAQAKAVRTK